MVEQSERWQGKRLRAVKEKQMPGPPPLSITLTDEERVELERLVRAQLTPQALAVRARVVLAAAAGDNNSAIARAVHTAPARSSSVGTW